MESSNQEELCNSLLDWFKVFYTENCFVRNQHYKRYLDDLADGVALAVALKTLVPEYFTESWFSKLKADVGTNWRLKVSNLKKILESVFDYYGEVLNISLNEFTRPNAMRIAEKHDQSELARLIQLVLGVAINCSTKSEHIRQIMDLEESLQRNIMQAIQEIETTYQGGMASKTGTSITNVDAKAIQGERDRLAQRCHEAERQIEMLIEEKSLLQQEVNKLQGEVESYGSPKRLIGDDGASLGPMLPGSNRYNDLRRQLDTLKDELVVAEAQRDDYKMKSMQLEEDIMVLKMKLGDSSDAQNELAQLKDELDALREANDKLKASEALIITYKKKLEDYSDLKRQIKQLEERNVDYLQQNLHQEENSKKLATIKGQVELYKKEIQELHTRLDTEINKCVKIEFDLSNTTAKLTALQREYENVTIERDTLLEQYEQLRCAETMPVSNADARNAISNELKIPAQRDRIRLLEEENKALREGQGGQTAMAQMLDDANQRAEKLREQLRVANQKILSLSSQDGNDVTKSSQQKESLEDQKGGAVLQSENTRLQSKCAQLEATLGAREQELMLLETKYRKCVEKAKDVIKCYEPRLLTDSPQMSDKNVDSENELLVASSQSQPTMSPLEERLFTTAFYNLAISCQRDVVDARLALINGGGQSFLSRQRQPTTRKPTLTNKRTK